MSYYTFDSEMQSRIVHIKKGIVSAMFLLLLGGIIFNSTFFLHTHRTACGKLIVHAHPFNKGAEKEDPLSQHSHNKIDLQVISSIDYFIFSHLTIDIDYKPVFESEILNKPCFHIDSNESLLLKTRGPPSSNFII